MDLNETKDLLKKYRITPIRLKGQNFLVREDVAIREVEAAAPKKGEVLLEVGPGLGALTEHLLARGCRVVAVERDPLLARVIRERFSGEDLELIEADVMKIDLPDFHGVVSNIPYVISSPLTFKLLERGFRIGVLTYQEEFARRLVAEPGDYDYSRLSVAGSYYGDIEILETLPPQAFYPPPKVRSAVVRITPKPPPFEVDEERFFSLVRGIFTVRRKTVKNALAAAKKVAGVDVDLERVPDRILKKRAYELTLEEIGGLLKAWD